MLSSYHLTFEALFFSFSVIAFDTNPCHLPKSEVQCPRLNITTIGNGDLKFGVQDKVRPAWASKILCETRNNTATLEKGRATGFAGLCTGDL